MPMQLLHAAVTRKDVAPGEAEVDGVIAVQMTVQDFIALMAAEGTDIINMEDDGYDMSDERALVASMLMIASLTRIVDIKSILTGHIHLTT